MIVLLLIITVTLLTRNVLASGIRWGKTEPRNPWYYQARTDSETTECDEIVDLSTEFMDWFRESQINPEILSRREEEYGSGEVMDQFHKEAEICKENPSNGIDSTVMERALCPWEWRLNRNKNREPKLISEARCLCRSARGSIGALCVPIHREFPVLKRVLCDKKRGKFKYVRTFETITVGCHSVLPRSQTALPLSHHLRTANEIKR